VENWRRIKKIIDYSLKIRYGPKKTGVKEQLSSVYQTKGGKNETVFRSASARSFPSGGQWMLCETNSFGTGPGKTGACSGRNHGSESGRTAGSAAYGHGTL
jgi:hypothetical protein